MGSRLQVSGVVLMPRRTLSLLVVLVIAGAGLVVYTHATQNASAPQDARRQTASAVASDDPVPAPVPLARPVTTAPDTPSVDALAKWQADTMDSDPQARAAAIKALGQAPSAAAVPVLGRVVGVGTDEDRQLALAALRLLAQRQGDADSQIRDALRVAIYHSDTDAATNGAQQTLDAVEHDLATTAPAGAH
jgi:hypothetical protein